MATRLILNELDLNLPALATGLILIIVVIISAHARTLGTAVVSGAVTGDLLQLVLDGRRVLLTNGGNVGHDGGKIEKATRRIARERSFNSEWKDLGDLNTNAQRGMMLLRGREDDQIE